MTLRVTPEQVEEIKAATKAVTYNGPTPEFAHWINDGPSGRNIRDGWNHELIAEVSPGPSDYNNATFIAQARHTIPALLETIEAVTAERDALLVAIEPLLEDERNDLRQTVSQMNEALEAVTAERDELQQVVDDLSAEVNRLVQENERLKKEFLADFVPNEESE